MGFGLHSSWILTQRQPAFHQLSLTGINRACEVLPGCRGRMSLEWAQGCSKGHWPQHHTQKYLPSVPSQFKPKGCYFCQEIQQFLGISKPAFETDSRTWHPCFCSALADIYLQSSNCCQHITKSVKWLGGSTSSSVVQDLWQQHCGKRQCGYQWNMELTVWVRAGGSGWGRGGARGTQQLFSPTTLGHQAVASGFLRLWGRFCPAARARTSLRVLSLPACSDQFPIFPTGWPWLCSGSHFTVSESHTSHPGWKQNTTPKNTAESSIESHHSVWFWILMAFCFSRVA